MIKGVHCINSLIMRLNIFLHIIAMPKKELYTLKHDAWWHALTQKLSNVFLKCICLSLQKKVKVSWQGKTKDQGVTTL